MCAHWHESIGRSRRWSSKAASARLAQKDWTKVLPLLPEALRVVRYDRPGYGTSEDDLETPTLRHNAAVLHDTLAAAGIAAPYLLVGHSLGGSRIRMFAGLYPNDVAGLV